MDTLWRLAWALPLVLGIGFVAALVLRRVVSAPPAQATRRIALQESLSLSDDTRVHVIEVDRQPYLLVESSSQATLQALSARAADAAPAPSRPGPAWAQRLVARARP